jgi:hypothetical protein
MARTNKLALVSDPERSESAVPSQVRGLGLSKSSQESVDQTKVTRKLRLHVHKMDAVVLKAWHAQRQLKQLHVSDQRTFKEAVGELLAIRDSAESTEERELMDEYTEVNYQELANVLRKITSLTSRKLADIIDEPIDPDPDSAFTEWLRSILGEKR